MLWADNSVKHWQNLPISNPRTYLHNINAHTKFSENPLMFTQVIIQKRNTDRLPLTDRQMEGHTYGHTDVQHETIISHHYRVAAIKSIDIISWLVGSLSLTLSEYYEGHA